jgi:hypothetical protein
LTSDAIGTPASTSAGTGFRYDFNETYHLLGYVRRGIENTDQTDRYAWYASFLFTFSLRSFLSNRGSRIGKRTSEDARHRDYVGPSDRFERTLCDQQARFLMA